MSAPRRVVSCELRQSEPPRVAVPADIADFLRQEAPARFPRLLDARERLGRLIAECERERGKAT